MLKLLALLFAQINAVTYYSCDDRAYCRLYRNHLIWGGEETKYDFSYFVDELRIDEDESAIFLDLKLHEHNIPEEESGLSSLYEPVLEAKLSFYANGAMRVEVDDLSHTRFKLSETEIDNLMINNQLEKVKDFASCVSEQDNYHTVIYKDTNG